MIRAAIFDMDGTLLDSMGVWYKVTEAFLAKHQISMSLEFAKKVQEMTLDESCIYMTSEFNLPVSPKELLADLNALVRHEYYFNIPLKHGAKDYLLRLYKSGIKLAVATSGFGDLCEAALTRLGIYNLFETVVTSSEVGVNKSNPDIYLLAAERLGVNPSECVVYEDIFSAVIGAKKAGMKVVGIYDASSAEFINEIKSTADLFITGWDELLEKDNII